MKASFLNTARNVINNHFAAVISGLLAAGLVVSIATTSFGQGVRPVDYSTYRPSYDSSGYDSRRHESRYAPASRLPNSNSYDALYEQYLREYGLNGSSSSPSSRELDRWRYPDQTTPQRPSYPVQPAPTQPVPGYREETVNPAAEAQAKITARYSNPTVVRFAEAMSAERMASLYNETSNLIDSRHMQPTTYDVRVRKALENLSYAVENSTFLTANRISPSRQQIDGFRNGLNQMAQTSVRSSSEAVNVMYRTMQMAGQTLGLRASTVGMEFIYGAAESLDKYSGFVPEDVRSQPSASALDDHVVGIGVEIKPHDQGVLVVKPISGGPAAKAGLRADDVIVAINGRSLKGQGLEAVVDQISGPAGSTLSLDILREGRTSRVTLTRQRVEIKSVSEVKMLNGADGSRVGYLKLDKFAANSNNEMDQALWSLHQQGMQSLIIDLRGNPGGLLTTAIQLSNKFLPSGTIVSTRGRTAQDNTQETATREQTWKTPLTVLIDENSASASEIFAAAIQENGRGIIVGRKSYGKGSVQTHFPLQSAPGNLRLTTAKFYAPSGRVMADAGVTPDVPVDAARGTARDRNGNDGDIAMALQVAASSQVRQMAGGVR